MKAKTRKKRAGTTKSAEIRRKEAVARHAAILNRLEAAEDHIRRLYAATRKPKEDGEWRMDLEEKFIKSSKDQDGLRERLRSLIVHLKDLNNNMRALANDRILDSLMCSSVESRIVVLEQWHEDWLGTMELAEKLMREEEESRQDRWHRRLWRFFFPPKEPFSEQERAE